MSVLDSLKINLYADGADLEGIVAMYRKPYIKGFTTNPTLMRKAGITDYEAFAHKVLEVIRDRPVSFEVFADEPREMKVQAMTIAGWAKNVNVKIPVSTTNGSFCGELIKDLCDCGVAVNVTAVFTIDQVERIAAALNPDVPAIVSVFAGRIADAGIDPIPVMRQAKSILSGLPRAQLLWASPREVLNVVQADESGCDIITATTDILAKLPGLGKDLEEFSLDTVRMFHRDATASNYSIRSASSDNGQV